MRTVRAVVLRQAQCWTDPNRKPLESDAKMASSFPPKYTKAHRLPLRRPTEYRAMRTIDPTISYDERWLAALRAALEKENEWRR